MEVEIRRAEDADLEAVVEIQKAIIQKGVPSDWINRVNLYLGRPESICLVAVRDNDVIGYFFGKIMYGAFGLERSGWSELPLKKIGFANEIGDKDVDRVFINFLRGINLLDFPQIHHRNSIGNFQGFFLIVSDIDHRQRKLFLNFSNLFS